MTRRISASSIAANVADWRTTTGPGCTSNASRGAFEPLLKRRIHSAATLPIVRQGISTLESGGWLSAQIISSLFAPTTATSSGTRSPSSVEASSTSRPSGSCTAKTATGLAGGAAICAARWSAHSTTPYTHADVVRAAKRGDVLSGQRFSERLQALLGVRHSIMDAREVKVAGPPKKVGGFAAHRPVVDIDRHRPTMNHIGVCNDGRDFHANDGFRQARQRFR